MSAMSGVNVGFGRIVEESSAAEPEGRRRIVHCHVVPDVCGETPSCRFWLMAPVAASRNALSRSFVNPARSAWTGGSDTARCPLESTEMPVGVSKRASMELPSTIAGSAPATPATVATFAPDMSICRISSLPVSAT